MVNVGWIVAAVAGLGLIVWGADLFADNVADAAARMRVSTFAVALLVAGAEPEELATAVTAARRGAPAIAFGDVIGANVALCLLAVGVGALTAPLPFPAGARRHAVAAVLLGAGAAWCGWDGHVGRAEGALLITAYVGYVIVVWRSERTPPAIGELGELGDLGELRELDERGGRSPGSRRIGREFWLVVVGVATLAIGALLLVEAVSTLAGTEDTQTTLGLTVVGAATAAELVVLAWRSARRGVPDAVLAAVVGSFTYNATMTLGAGALAGPLRLVDAAALHGPWVAMVASLCVVIIAGRSGRIGRTAGIGLIAGYGLFVALVAIR